MTQPHKRVLLAGASGHLGRLVGARLRARGHHVVALARDPARLQLGTWDSVHLADALKPPTLRGACDNVDVVFSCVGASVALELRGWSSYTSLDVRANTALIEAAVAANVPRFVYVSVSFPPAMKDEPYVAAHETVVNLLRKAPLQSCVVRPTGFYSALRPLLDLARKNQAVSFGQGTAKSNPIADEDLAQVCVEAIEGTASEIEAGGPDVLTRDEMLHAAFDALGKPFVARKAGVGLLRFASTALGPFHPRLSQLTSFVAALSVHDAVAPRVGTRRFVDDLREHAKGRPA